MGVATEEQSKGKRRRRKLFVQDRSFFGDGSLIYPEVNQRTVDGDVLKLKLPKKSQLKKGKWQHNIKVITGKCDGPHSVETGHCKSDLTNKDPLSECSSICSEPSFEPQMENVKRKRLDTPDSHGPASQKQKTESFEADDHRQIEESSPIIDVLGVSSDLSDHTELSNIPGHHEEWNFSSLENTVVTSNSSTQNYDTDQTKAQSEKKRDFVQRFLSDAISTLGMEDKCLDNTSDDEELSSDDITEAADLISSHKRNVGSISFGKEQNKCGGMKRAKYTKTTNEFSDTGPLSSGHKWLLKQMLPNDGTSSVNLTLKCSSPINAAHSDSEDSLQVLEHIRPAGPTIIKNKRKKLKKDKGEKEERKKEREKKGRKRKQKEKHHHERKMKETNELKKHTAQDFVSKIKEKECRKRSKKIEIGIKEVENQRNEQKKMTDAPINEKMSKHAPLKPEKKGNLKTHNIFPSNDCNGTANELKQIGKSNKIHSKKKKVTVEVQLTNDEILHPSSINNSEEAISSHKCLSKDEGLISVRHKEEVKKNVRSNKQCYHGLETHDFSHKAKKVTDKIKKKKAVVNDFKGEPTVDSEVNCKILLDFEQIESDSYERNRGNDSSTTNDINFHIDVSTLEEFPMNQENSCNKLQKNSSRVEKKLIKRKKRKEDSELATSETLQQLVQKASSSLKKCGSSSTNEYSPDLFDGVIEDTGKTNTVNRTGEQNHHDSSLEETPDSHEYSSVKYKEHDALALEGHPENLNLLNQLQKNIIGEEKKGKRKKNYDCKLAGSETLQQLVQKASSSLKKSESASTNEYSPDLFDANLGDTTEMNNINRRIHRSQHQDPGEISLSHAILSKESKEEKTQFNGKKTSAKKKQGLEKVGTNSLPEAIDSQSPWHRLSQDSNGSFMTRSDEFSKISSQVSNPYQNVLMLHSEMNVSHNDQRLNSSFLETNESSSDEILNSAATLNPHTSSPCKLVCSNQNLKKLECFFDKNNLKKNLMKSRKSSNKSGLKVNSQSVSQLSKNIVKKQRVQETTTKSFEIKEKDGSKQGKIKCTRCHVCFNNEVKMALHRCNERKKKSITVPHRTSSAVHRCDCGKAYVTKSALGFHIRSVHLGLRPYQCDECPMSFSCKQTLVIHKRFHSNTLPFECCICSKQTRTVWNLHRHYSQAHRMNPSFPCILCPHKNVCFYFEHDLKDHMNKIHLSSTINPIKSL